MCGIAGFLGDFSPSLLKLMNDSQAHRGPDGDGVWNDVDAGIGLAHRRLSIIDTSEAAAQPMQGVNGRYVVTFNGAIYNFRELAEDLTGYEFNRDSDTAVLAPMYDRHGPSMVERLNGMFAFAIWDRQERTLFLARDHIGIKPLHYTMTPGGFLFASEIRGLLAADIPRAIEPKALHGYLTNLWSAGERTLMKDVLKLNPGHRMLIRAGETPEPVRYYSPPIAASAPSNPPVTPEALWANFKQVVRDQCVADVPVGAFLSGGVDSTAIVAAMMDAGIQPHASYCMVFPQGGMAEDGFAEDVGFARKAAKHLGLQLTEVEASADGLERLPELIEILEEPLGDPAPLFVHDIAAQARTDGVKVLLGGTGGDDVFGGYRRHRVAALRDRFGWAKGALGPLAGATGRFFETIGRHNTSRRASKLSKLLSGSDDRFLTEAFNFSPDIDASSVLLARHDDNSVLGHQCGHTRNNALLPRLMNLEFYGFVPDHNLTYTDKAAMKQAIETRVPFLDTRLLDFAAAMRPNQLATARSTKTLLKKSLEPILPHDVLYRPKTGFGAPIRRWLFEDRPDYVQDVLTSDKCRERGIFQPDVVNDIIAQTARKEIDGAYFVLSLLMIELWCDRFLDH